MAAGAHLELIDALRRLGAEEAVAIGRGEAGAAGGAKRTRLVHDDVRVRRADDALPVAEHAAEADDVGAGAADAELDHGVWALACGADELAGVVAVGVALRIAHVLLCAHVADGVENLGRGAL